MKFHGEQRIFFLAALTLVTIAFIAVLLPFYSALMWAAILALLFAPLQRWFLARMPGRVNLATLLTLLVVILAVVLPVVAISMSLMNEGAALYGRFRSGQLNFGAYLGQIVDALPNWARNLLDERGLLDISSIQQKLAESASRIGQMLAGQAVSLGQNTVSLLAGTGICLYVLFFLLRDGRELAAIVRRAIPLADEQTSHLVSKFNAVIKATVKGNIAVAMTQGALGGVILWFLDIQGAVLWAVVMAFLSLLPAVGAGLIWGPIAIYFLATGAIWQGVILMAWGVFVIGLVDNILRPILVGQSTKMPDYVVLVSTVGGMSLFGLNGFVIGPLIAALFMACWDLYVSPDKVREEQREEAIAAVLEEAERADRQKAREEKVAQVMAAGQELVDEWTGAAGKHVSEMSDAVGRFADDLKQRFDGLGEDENEDGVKPDDPAVRQAEAPRAADTPAKAAGEADADGRGDRQVAGQPVTDAREAARRPARGADAGRDASGAKASVAAPEPRVSRPVGDGAWGMDEYYADAAAHPADASPAAARVDRTPATDRPRSGEPESG